jgi:hypothetical protein
MPLISQTQNLSLVDNSREDLASNLVGHLITQGHCLSVSAPNNFGKSHFLRLLATVATSASHNNLVPVYLDCNLRADDSQQALYVLLLKELLAVFKHRELDNLYRELVASPTSSSFQINHAFLTAFEIIKELLGSCGKKRLVLVLDEFDQDELRYYVLGLPAANSLLVGLELARPGNAQLAPEDSLLSLLNLRYQTDEGFRRQYALREPTPAERLLLEIRGWLALVKEPLDALAELSKAVTISASTLPFDAEDAGPHQTLASNSEATSNDNEANGAKGGEAAPIGPRPGAGGSGNWPSVEQSQPRSGNNPGQGETFGRVSRLTIPVESPHPFPAVTRQYWEVANPDEEAPATRLHFSRIDLGNNSPSQARIVLESFGRKQTQVISAQQRDFWSDPLPGRSVTVRFLADNATPAWGFVLDALESVSLTTNAAAVTAR